MRVTNYNNLEHVNKIDPDRSISFFLKNNKISKPLNFFFSFEIQNSTLKSKYRMDLNKYTTAVV